MGSETYITAILVILILLLFIGVLGFEIQKAITKGEVVTTEETEGSPPTAPPAPPAPPAPAPPAGRDQPLFPTTSVIVTNWATPAKQSLLSTVLSSVMEIVVDLLAALLERKIQDAKDAIEERKARVEEDLKSIGLFVNPSI